MFELQDVSEMSIEEAKCMIASMEAELTKLREYVEFKETRDSMFLLSVSEYKEYKATIDYYSAVHCSWWLRDGIVKSGINVEPIEYGKSDVLAVRPAIVVETDEQSIGNIRYAMYDNIAYPMVKIGDKSFGSFYIAVNPVEWYKYDDDEDTVYEDSMIAKRIACMYNP